MHQDFGTSVPAEVAFAIPLPCRLNRSSEAPESQRAYGVTKTKDRDRASTAAARKESERDCQEDETPRRAAGCSGRPEARLSEEFKRQREDLR